MNNVVIDVSILVDVFHIKADRHKGTVQLVKFLIL